MSYIPTNERPVNAIGHMKTAVALSLMAILLLMFAPVSDADWTSMDCPLEPGVQSTTLTWVRVADPQVACSGKTLDRGGACIVCTEPVNGHMTCTLYAEPPGVVDDIVLGHEVKHAFGCKHGKYF